MNKGVEFLYSVTSIPDLQKFFDSNKNMDIVSIRDDKRNTVLHNATFHNRFEIVKVLMEHVKRVEEGAYWANTSVQKKPIKQVIQAFINEGNAEGLTCMHYASYRGNVEMLKWLQALGGNLMATTRSSFSLMHSAAKGDQLGPILYLHSKGDLNNSLILRITEKHQFFMKLLVVGVSQWSSFFLLAQQDVEVDVFDSQNQTPLHLAVQNGRTQIVKRLLIKGADRSLTNGKGQTPIQIAKSLELNRITNILNNNYRCKDYIKFYFNVKIKYEPQKRSYLKSFLFLLGLLYVAVASHLFIIPSFNIGILYGSASLNAILLVMFIALLFIKPQSPNPIEYKYLTDKLPICSICQIQKKIRSHHCDICKVCVPQYDHHCPWINRCVGKHNIVLFVIFLVLLVITMLENIFWDVVGIFELDFAFKQYRNFNASQQTTSVLKIQYKLIISISLAIIAVFIIPVLILLYHQMTNLFKNATTHQRFSGAKSRVNNINRSENESEQSLLQRQDGDDCSFGNCKIMCQSEKAERNNEQSQV